VIALDSVTSPDLQLLKSGGNDAGLQIFALLVFFTALPLPSTVRLRLTETAQPFFCGSAASPRIPGGIHCFIASQSKQKQISQQLDWQGSVDNDATLPFE